VPPEPPAPPEPLQPPESFAPFGTSPPAPDDLEIGPIGCPVVVSSVGRLGDPASVESKGATGFGLSLCRHDDREAKHARRRRGSMLLRNAVDIIFMPPN
jgi:hypothetical protein